MKRPWPTRSSTLSPKIQRYHMFPITCDQLPCRNIDVISVGALNVAGTTPYTYRNWLSVSGGIDSSNSHASAFSTMIVTVMYGVVRDGMTSRRGIIGYESENEKADFRLKMAD